MLIDLSQLTDIAIDGGAMIAAVGPTVTGRELDAALVERDLFVPVGHCGTVGLGGFALAGGYGWNSRSRGPACLNIRAIDVVLANGELVHADDSNHPELLWAARGSGPGFFGVVTRFHFELCPRPRMLRTGYVFPLSVHDEVLSWALDLLPTLPAEVEASARVGYSNIIGEQAVTLTGLAFAPDGAATGPAGLLEPLGSCPVVDRALRRFSGGITMCARTRAGRCWGSRAIQPPLRRECWVDESLRSLAGYSCGVQFSDANLPARSGRGLSVENSRRLEEIRAGYDPDGLFFSYLLPD